MGLIGWLKYPENQPEKCAQYKVIKRNEDNTRYQAINHFDGYHFWGNKNITHFAPLDEMPPDEDLDEDFIDLEKQFSSVDQSYAQGYPYSRDSTIYIERKLDLLFEFLKSKFRVKK